MTFMKLKQNMSYAMLAISFEVSSQACKELIWKMIDILCFFETEYSVA
ncbi:GSCOCG00012907001-RA-CDS [Cotesia congregata]|nr:GSCOCG00012907001-RA-CDS [Cotesia congregata]